MPTARFRPACFASTLCLQLSFTPADGAFVVQRNSDNGVSAQFHSPTFNHFWFVDFAAPGDRLLAIGAYPGAVR